MEPTLLNEPDGEPCPNGDACPVCAAVVGAFRACAEIFLCCREQQDDFSADERAIATCLAGLDDAEVGEALDDFYAGRVGRAFTEREMRDEWENHHPGEPWPWASSPVELPRAGWLIDHPELH